MMKIKEVLSQLNTDSKLMQDELFNLIPGSAVKPFGSGGTDFYRSGNKNIAVTMNQDFTFSGKAMRVLAVISISSHCALSKSDGSNNIHCQIVLNKKEVILMQKYIKYMKTAQTLDSVYARFTQNKSPISWVELTGLPYEIPYKIDSNADNFRQF